MTIPANGSPLFDVRNSNQMAQRFKSLIDKAIANGLEDQVMAANAIIRDKLRREAHIFGEPLYHLPNLGIQMRLALVAPIAIIFSVNMAAHRVWIANVQLVGLQD